MSITDSFPSDHLDGYSDHDCVMSFEDHANRTLIVILKLIWIDLGDWYGNFGLCGHEWLACNHNLSDHDDHKSAFEYNDDCMHCIHHHSHERGFLKSNAKSPWADNIPGVKN